MLVTQHCSSFPVGIRATVYRLPFARVEAMRKGTAAWREFDSDAGVIFRAEREEQGKLPFIGGTDALGCGDLDKAWSALRYLLDPARRDGRDDPSTPGGAAVAGWHSLPDFYRQEFDYIPGYNTPDETAEIAEALRRTDFAAALDEHGPSLHEAQLYYPYLGEPFDEGARDYLTFYFGVVQSLYTEAANQEQATLTTLG